MDTPDLATRRRVLAALSAAPLVLATMPAKAGAPAITVYKSPACECCGRWMDHLRANGFAVSVREVDDLDAVMRKYGVPGELASCHTATVGTYVIEGHVPAADILRLLSQRPKAQGLAVPGMPAGSPGMEGPRRDPYEVLAFDRDGATRVFARHR